MGRTRNWELIIYPESCDVELMLDELSDMQVNYYLSPLHDKDRYNKLDAKKQEKLGVKVNVGELKKPHYHLVLCFEGVKSLEQIQILAGELGASLYVKEVHSLVGALRYLCHLDEGGKKELYDIHDVICRFRDYEKKIMLKNEVSMVPELMEVIKNENIKEFADLLTVLIESENFKLLDFCQRNSYFVVSICKSFIFRTVLKKPNVEKEPKKMLRAWNCDEDIEDVDNNCDVDNDIDVDDVCERTATDMAEMGVSLAELASFDDDNIPF